jgi:hypothetical protein
MPACTVTLFLCVSTSRIAPKSSRFTIHADVQVRSEGECPLPTVTTRRRIRLARVTIFCISGRLCGRMYSSGREWKVRAHVWCMWAGDARKGTSGSSFSSSEAKASGMLRGKTGDAILVEVWSGV